MSPKKNIVNDSEKKTHIDIIIINRTELKKIYDFVLLTKMFLNLLSFFFEAIKFTKPSFIPNKVNLDN